MEKKGEWDSLLGIRRDIDLTERWWHRLFKVLYLVSASIVVVAMVFILWDSFKSADIKTGYIKITATLGGYLRTAEASVPNVVPTFQKAPGKAGLISEDGKTVGYLSDYSMTKSWCTPSALDHLQETADFLNERNYTKAHTGMTVLNSVTSMKLKASEPARLCWMDSGLQGRDFDDIVKWEFTTLGYYKAIFDHYLMPTFWLLVVHTILLNFYYRGLVYIIVGKRKKPQLKPVDEDDELIA